MSNAERWDHSGYNELINEDKPNNYKKQIGNKKHFYKYKDNTGMNEKQNVSEYLDHSQMNNRKNQSKKFPNYSYNKYHNDEWGNESEKGRETPNPENFDNQGGSNSFKGKYKKKKKGEGEYQDGIGENKTGLNEFYNKKNEERLGNLNSNSQNYPSNNLNYGNVRQIEQPNTNSNINYNPNNINNPNYYGRNKTNNQQYNSLNVNQGVNNNVNSNYTLSNSGFSNNINPNYQSTNPKTIPINNPPFTNYNNYMPSTPFNMKGSVSSGNNFNSTKQNSNNQVYKVQGHMNNTPSNLISHSPGTSTDSNHMCQKIVMDDHSYLQNEEELLIQQNKIVNSEIYGSNSKKQHNKGMQNNNYTIESTDVHNITRNSDDKNSLPNTPNRNSGTNYQSNTTSNTSLHMSTQTPSNSVGFSPKSNAEPIYMGNMIKMPNNYNFNSPIMHDNFLYPNFPNTRNPINMNNMNGPYYGMMNGMNPINMNAMEPSTFQGMPNNFNPSINPNFGTFPFNNPSHHMPIIPQMKGPLVNNMNQNNMNNMSINQGNMQHANKNNSTVEMYKNNNNVSVHNEEMYCTDPRSGVKKTANVNIPNNNIQMSRGINNPVVNNNPINNNTSNFNTYERSGGPGNVYNSNPTTKKGMQPYNNNFINNNININNLNYNQMNINNKNFNNRKINNNFNPNMNNINQNPLQRMKFVKSDKNLMANLQNQNSFKIQHNQQESQSENRDSNSNSKSSNNKIWRDSKTNNSANIESLTNIINNTIKGTGIPNSSTIKNNTITYSTFNSIKEEQQQNENLVKCKTLGNLHSRQIDMHNLEDKYFSSNDSEYSIAEEEIKCDEKEVLLYVYVRISGREEVLEINSKEDNQITIRKFISKHRLNEKLIKPITEQVLNALFSIESLLQSKLDRNHCESLNKIKKFYSPRNEEELDKLPELDLSCFTDFGGSLDDANIYLSKEEAKKSEKLNMSR